MNLNESDRAESAIRKQYDEWILSKTSDIIAEIKYLYGDLQEFRQRIADENLVSLELEKFDKEGI